MSPMCPREKWGFPATLSKRRPSTQWYNSSMKEKTSITLSSEVLARIDRLAGSSRSRSAFIENVLRGYLLERERAAVQARDLERINRVAEQLNSEAADVMEYQTVVE